MSKLITLCPYCQKPLKLKSSLDLGKERLNIYECGHALAAEIDLTKHSFETHSITGNLEAFDYQKEGVDFAVNQTHYNCLIADQMGLGKTIQALLAHRAQYAEKSPALYIVKSSTTWQWRNQYKKWCDPLPHGIFMILDSDGWIPPGFNSYIISMDLVANQGRCQCGHSGKSHPEKEDGRCKGTKGKPCKCLSFAPVETMIDKLLKLNFKLVVADEVHSFKNVDSARSQALMKLFKGINTVKMMREASMSCPGCGHHWTKDVEQDYDTSKNLETIATSDYCPNCNAYCHSAMSKEKIQIPERQCGVIMLSGTPVINRASEYFVPLNILDPARFYSMARFQHEWLEPDDKGRFTRIKSWRLEEFRKLISEYVIRRERNEVLKDLPKFRRTYTTIQMDSEELQGLYNKEIEKLVQKADEAGRDVTFRDIQSNISSMRRIAALAKVDYVIDTVQEFLDETEDEKIALGIHHVDVRNNLAYALSLHHPIIISGEDDAHSKFRKVADLAKPNHRLAIISTLAGGTGIDGLQVINNIMVLERQWSSAYEDQFEDRFNRQGQTRPVTCDYVHIKNTVDDFFHQMVEEKRDIIGETVENDYTPMSLDASAMKFVDWSAANKV